MNQSITWLNELSTREAAAEFLKCCGSKRWAEAMTAARPFDTVDDLLVKAGSFWWSLNDSDWLEAFRAHPKIGEQKAATLQSAEAQKWSAQEQSGVAYGSRQTISELARKNPQPLRSFPRPNLSLGNPTRGTQNPRHPDPGAAARPDRGTPPAEGEQP